MSELYQLPDGWEWKKLGDVLFDIKTGTTPPKVEQKYFDNPTINWFSPSDFGEHKELVDSKNKVNLIAVKDKKVKLYLSNSLLLVAIGATVGKIGIIRKEASSNQQITAIKFKNNVDVDFVYYWLSNIKQIIIDTASAATLPIINQNGIKSLSFPLPPLPEQQRIVAKLDALFKKIDKAIALHVKNMEEADGFMASVLNEVFSELAEKYGSQKLSNIVKINSGIALPSIFKDIDKSDGEYEFFKVAQMNNDKRIMKDADLNFTLSQSKEYKIKLFPKGSVLIPKRGGAILTNKKRIMEKDASYDSNIMGLKADTKILSDEFLFKFLDSINLADFVDTSTIPQINNKHIEMMNISVPPQIIQENVVTYLDNLSSKIEHVKKVQKEKMESLKALKASILDSAFRGEL